MNNENSFYSFCKKYRYEIEINGYDTVTIALLYALEPLGEDIEQ